MKKFENPMLQIVSINKKDIIATSETLGVYNTAISDENAVYGADRFRDWND